MKKQVKVKVSWNEKGFQLSTDNPAAFLNAPVVPEAPIHPVALAIGEKSVTPIRKR